NRQSAEPVVAEHADIDLATLDILLGDGSRSDLIVDECDALHELLVAVDDGRLRYSPRRILAEALDDQRQRETCGTFDLAAHREYGEGRHRDPAIVDQRLRPILAARQDQAARVAP